MNNLWPSIEIIFYHEELLEKSKEVISEVKKDLGQKPRERDNKINQNSEFKNKGRARRI